MVPLVIEFLAGLVGISSPAPQIRGIVEKIQGTVDKALDWLVEKAKEIGQGLLSALGIGGKKEDDPNAMPDGEVQTQFSMGPEGHTLTARVQGGKLDVWMASGEETRIALMLYGAINEVEHGEFPEPDRSNVLAKLRAAKVHSDRNTIWDEWEKRDPRSKGYGPKEFHIYLALRLAQIVGDLQPLAGFGITNLDSFFSAPKDKRYLPAGYDVRAKLYERGSTWGSTRTSVFRTESTRIRQAVDAANALLATDKAGAERAWEQLRKADEIPSVATLGKFTSADVDKTKYHVDHKDALAVHWMTVGFNEKGDEGRQGITVRPGNLRLITAEANLRKGAKTEDGDRGTYTNFVGPDFESGYAPGGKNAKSIDGQAFTDAAGNPIR
jgi:hypothetical protein